MSIHYNYLIVDERNATLWVRSRASATPRVALSSYRALQVAYPSKSLYLLESDEDLSTGTETAVRYVLPYAQACEDGHEGPAAVVEVWHRSELSVESYFSKETPSDLKRAEFIQVAAVLAPAESALSCAYELTQNIDANWCPLKPMRSSMPGDVLVLRAPGEEEQIWVVKAIGWARAASFA